MDFESILNERLPDSVDKSVVTSITNALNKGLREELQNTFGKKIKTLAGAGEAFEALNEQLTDAQETNAELMKNGDDSESEFKTKYEAEAAAHAETKSLHETTTKEYEDYKTSVADGETKTAALNATVDALLKQGFNPKRVEQFKAMNIFDAGQLKRDAKGQFTNLEKYVEELKTNELIAGDFGEVQETITETGTPPAGDSSKAGEGQFDFNFTAVRPIPKKE